MEVARAMYTNPRILVVDDTPMNLTVMRGLLKALRIQIDTAESAAASVVDVPRSIPITKVSLLILHPP